MCDNFHILGSGAKAVVYLGMNRATGVFVAVKELHLPQDDPAEARQILTEVQRLRELSHPNVIKCYGAKAHHDKVHIILEYCAGGSVSRTVRHFGALTESVCKRYVRDVLEGLRYLHGVGVCHRDVKPENLLLTVDGRCKLGDLGSSKALPEGGGGLETCVGTPQYMAPEVIGDDESASDGDTHQGDAPVARGYGTAADIWSLGCCVYEMLVGAPLITGTNPMAIMYAIASRQDEEIDLPPPVRRYSEGSGRLSAGEDETPSVFARDFVNRCVKYHPSQRLSAADLLGHPWITDGHPPQGASDDYDRSAFHVDDVLTPTYPMGTTIGSAASSSSPHRKSDALQHPFNAYASTGVSSSIPTVSSPATRQLTANTFTSTVDGSMRAPHETTAVPTNDTITSDTDQRHGASHSSADFEPIRGTYARTIGGGSAIDALIERVDGERLHNTVSTVGGHVSSINPHNHPAWGSEESSSAQITVASPVVSRCQYCRVVPALFECDECRKVFGNMHRLCPVCWPKAHGKLAATSASRHVKRPILTSAPYSAPMGGDHNEGVTAAQSVPERSAPPPSNVPRPLSATRTTLGGGVLLSNGAYVGLSAYEETGWTCGGCQAYNDASSEACTQCGHLN